jgi:hypothetical protein
MGVSLNISHTRFLSLRSFINTLLQRGVLRQAETENRFQRFLRPVENR